MPSPSPSPLPLPSYPCSATFGCMFSCHRWRECRQNIKKTSSIATEWQERIETDRNSVTVLRIMYIVALTCVLRKSESCSTHSPAHTLSLIDWKILIKSLSISIIIKEIEKPVSHELIIVVKDLWMRKMHISQFMICRIPHNIQYRMSDKDHMVGMQISDDMRCRLHAATLSCIYEAQIQDSIFFELHTNEFFMNMRTQCFGAEGTGAYPYVAYNYGHTYMVVLMHS